jgi:hypothetical protein
MIKMACSHFSSIYSNEEIFEYAFEAIAKKFDKMDSENCSD